MPEQDNTLDTPDRCLEVNRCARKAPSCERDRRTSGRPDHKPRDEAKSIAMRKRHSARALPIAPGPLPRLRGSSCEGILV